MKRILSSIFSWAKKSAASQEDEPKPQVVEEYETQIRINTILRSFLP